MNFEFQTTHAAVRGKSLFRHGEPSFQNLMWKEPQVRPHSTRMLKEAQGRYIVHTALQHHEIPANHAFTLHKKPWLSNESCHSSRFSNRTLIIGQICTFGSKWSQLSKIVVGKGLSMLAKL